MQWDAVVVGCGPAGGAAAVYLARSDLDVLVYDRGPSSLARCAYLENYLGFPGGVDVATFRELVRDHARVAGATLRDDLVAAVDRDERGVLRVEPQDGDTVTADAVVAATKDDDAYLDPLDDGDLFATRESGGESYRVLADDAVDAEGRTSVDGLYVAGPLGAAGDQALVAAGHGATVARALLTDRRRDDGYWKSVAEWRDWRRKAENRDADWDDAMTAWFEAAVPPDADPDTVDRLRDALWSEQDAKFLAADEADRRWREAQRRLLAHLDPDVVRAYVDEELD